MNTIDIIQKCFNKAKVPMDDRHKYLFQLLADETYKAFEKQREKELEDLLVNLLFDGYSLEYCNGNTITCGQNAPDYNGKKDFVVEKGYGKPVGFNTVKGAMKRIEKEA